MLKLQLFILGVFIAGYCFGEAMALIREYMYK